MDDTNTIMGELNENRQEEAETEYSSLVNILNNGLKKSIPRILQNTAFGDNYRGLLLGRPFAQGAKYNEFFTARLQHDVKNSKVSLSLQKLSATFNENSDMLPLLSNVQIIDELCETLRILLDGEQYTKAQKVKFIKAKKKKDKNKIQEVNRHVVSALFNVGKRENIQMKDFNIDHKTRVMMLNKCLEWSEFQQQQLVTEKIAKKVYAKFVGDTTGKDRRDINLIEATKGFGKQLETLMVHGYIDVQMDFTTTEEMDSLSFHDRTPPSVRSFEIVHPTSRDLLFCVSVIDNPVSPIFRKKWIEQLDQLAFLKGQKGKKGAYIRNASTTQQPSPFVIGNQLVYAGLTAVEMERQLIEIAVFFADFQTKMIERLYPLYKVTYYCNQVHTMVAALTAALYGAHSDAKIGRAHV